MPFWIRPKVEAEGMQNFGFWPKAEAEGAKPKIYRISKAFSQQKNFENRTKIDRIRVKILSVIGVSAKCLTKGQNFCSSAWICFEMVLKPFPMYEKSVDTIAEQICQQMWK